MTENYENIANIQVDRRLYQFVNEEILPGTGVTSSNFWNGFAAMVSELAPRNRQLLQKRQALQKKIDEYWPARHEMRIQERIDAGAQIDFLKEIGYIVPEGEDFTIETQGLDAEVSHMAGPQLVVPVDNARYALNAANARWGSLYDALYGSNVIAQEGAHAIQPHYNPVRGKAVIHWAKEFLNQIFPLQGTNSHNQVVDYHVEQGVLVALTKEDTVVTLKDKDGFVGYTGKASSPNTIILCHHNLHVMLKIDRTHTVGKHDDAGIYDMMMEAALSTIMDCEDSVAAVDAPDKIGVYRNWLGLMKGDLSANLMKNGKEIKRVLHDDIHYMDKAGQEQTLKGRSLMLVRNVGHLMTNPAILLDDGHECPEGMMDAAITALIALHDLKGNGQYHNSHHGSIYVVKPKMHGPEEVSLAVEIFRQVEDILNLPENTIKIGIMDEERRLTLNLKESIRAAKARVFFINTGFLDRTGDEIHTNMQAGVMIPKTKMKQTIWLEAYEAWNTHIGLSCGFSGKAQIGKGMWAIPDNMDFMLESKGAQIEQGATTAWVPSPLAATLHAVHYHQLDYVKIHQALLQKGNDASLEELLSVPICNPNNLDDDIIKMEIENNCQGLLGYVVHWIQSGVGCSKIPDINDVGLMEDRATLRISSQHLANWLYHGVCTQEEIIEILKNMAIMVDKQNQNHPNYRPIGQDDLDNFACRAAMGLIIDGTEQPSGYTEPLLHRLRQEYKASQR